MATGFRWRTHSDERLSGGAFILIGRFDGPQIRSAGNLALMASSIRKRLVVKGILVGAVGIELRPDIANAQVIDFTDAAEATNALNTSVARSRGTN